MTIAIDSSRVPKRIGTCLVEAGLLTPDQVETALTEQKQTTQRLGEVISSRGWVRQQTIDYIANQMAPSQPVDTSAPTSNEPSPMGLIQMLTGSWISQSISVAAWLGVADHLQAESKSIDELAQATQTQPQNLYRLLRMLASVGVFSEVEPKRFALTPMANFLCKDTPGSLRSLAMMFGDEWNWRSWGELRHIVQTGEAALQRLYQVDNTFKYFAQNPESGEIFNQAMGNWAMGVYMAVLDNYDFSPFQQVIDVAGGYGALLSSILARNPQAKGTLFDQPHVVDSAQAQLVESGMGDRVQTVGGDFFKSVPARGDAYVLSCILHDWSDEEGVQILKNVRQAIAPQGKLVVIETIVPPDNSPHFAKFLDLQMLVMYPGGRERTQAEYSTMFQAAGFEMTQMIHTQSPVSVIEGCPIN
ncbi:MAG: methyltransferase [Cyanobacteria bacterium J06635_15]